MPYFCVILHGTGILLESEDASPPIIGFYTTRTVSAVSAEEAVEKARRAVRALWASGEYHALNKGALPVLTVDTVKQVSLWQFLRSPNKGHTFYAIE